MTALLSKNIWDVPIAVVDTETTGLSADNGDRIVEIAVVRAASLMDNTVDTHSWLVNPEIAIPSRATEIHGIDDVMVEEAPVFSAIAPTLVDLLQETILVAHNAPFDTGFINNAFSRLENPPPAYGPIIDTVQIARRHFGFPSCSLHNLAIRMEVDLTQHHRAKVDALATFKLLQYMMNSIDPQRRLTTKDLLSLTDALKTKGLARIEMKRRLRQAARTETDVEIDYTRIKGPGDLKVTRRLSHLRIDFPKVKAWCHLRNAERVFWIDRIHRVQLIGTQMNTHET